MTGPLLAEFRDPDALKAAIAVTREAGYRAIDAFTPYPVEGVPDALGTPPSRIRYAMLAGGLAVAAFAFGLQWYSAAVDYRLNLGGRPLFSWQVFLLVPFEVGVFAAALSGMIAFMWACGLPKPNDPLFAVPGFERATQDRFFLLTAASSDRDGSVALRHLLEEAGAAMVTEVRQP